MRKFEVCKQYKKEDVILPRRSTKNSAGYDLYAAEDIKIPSLVKKIREALKYKEHIFNKVEAENRPSFSSIFKKINKLLSPTIVKTGVKVKMEPDEYLEIVNRSSTPLKKLLFVANGVGIIDSDYYENPDNDGEIGIIFWNISPFNYTIKKGDKIAQCIFHKFLITDDDYPLENDRTGGYGSTN